MHGARAVDRFLEDAVFLIRRLGISDEDELIDMMERNVHKQRLVRPNITGLHGLLR